MYGLRGGSTVAISIPNDENQKLNFTQPRQTKEKKIPQKLAQLKIFNLSTLGRSKQVCGWQPRFPSSFKLSQPTASIY